MDANKSELCLVVCETIQREVAAAAALEEMDGLSIAVYPAHCASTGVRPQLSDPTACPEGVRRAYLVGPCGKALAPGVRDQADGRVYRLASCTELFLPLRQLDSYGEKKPFLLLPAEVEYRLQQGNVAGRPATNHLALLDTGLNQESVEQAARLAARWQVNHGVIPVGLELLRAFLVRVLLEGRLENERARSTAALSEAIRRSSDHAMALDLIGSLTRIGDEAEAIESILDLFTMLFAPGKLAYLPIVGGVPRQAQVRLTAEAEAIAAHEQLIHFRGDYAWTESGKGFRLRIVHQEETLGLLEIDEVAFPAYLEHYLNLALILGRVCGLAISNSRVYEKNRQAEEIIRYQAYHDTLTGLPNRRFFNEQLTRALIEAEENQKLLAVMLVDLDHFKEVNDSLGHDAGDVLLKQVAQRIQGSIRTGDTVARMGGDEFLLCLPEAGRPEDVCRIAQRILDSLHGPFDIAGHTVQVGASIGIALYPNDSRDVESLLKHADASMYDVKEGGRNGYQLYGSK